MSAPTLSRTPAHPPASPTATRASRPTWRDPRLALGIGLVALCGLLGARLVGSADDTVPVWSLRDDKVAGQPVTQSDLFPLRVHFGSASDADHYVSAGDALPDGLVLTRDAAAGELLPRAALGAAADTDLVELPVTVPAGAVAATLEVGDLIDVWVTAKDAEDAERVLREVRVVALPEAGSSLSPSSDRQVVVGIGADQESRLPGVLARLATGTVVVTRHPGR